MKFDRKSAFLFSIFTLGLLCGYIPNVMAGCKINYEMQNNSKESINMANIQVKSRGGAWKKMSPFRMVGVGDKQESVYSATFGCKAKRRYRFDMYQRPGCRKNIYYPSATGWTTSTDINFGDISRHCK